MEQETMRATDYWLLATGYWFCPLLPTASALLTPAYPPVTVFPCLNLHLPSLRRPYPQIRLVLELLAKVSRSYWRPSSAAPSDSSVKPYKPRCSALRVSPMLFWWRTTCPR